MHKKRLVSRNKNFRTLLPIFSGSIPVVKPVDKRWCLPHKIHINSLLEFKSHILSRNSDLIASNIAGRLGLVRPVIKIMPSHHLLGPLSFSQDLVYFSSQYILDFLPTSEGLLGCLSIYPCLLARFFSAPFLSRENCVPPYYILLIA